MCNDGIVYVWHLAMGHLERRVAAHALFNEGPEYIRGVAQESEGSSLLSLSGKVPKTMGSHSHRRTSLSINGIESYPFVGNKLEVQSCNETVSLEMIGKSALISHFIFAFKTMIYTLRRDFNAFTSTE